MRRVTGSRTRICTECTERTDSGLVWWDLPSRSLTLYMQRIPRMRQTARNGARQAPAIKSPTNDKQISHSGSPIYRCRNTLPHSSYAPGYSCRRRNYYRRVCRRWMTRGNRLTHSVRHEILEDSLNLIIAFDHYRSEIKLDLDKDVGWSKKLASTIFPYFLLAIRFFSDI